MTEKFSALFCQTILYWLIVPVCGFLFAQVFQNAALGSSLKFLVVLTLLSSVCLMVSVFARDHIVLRLGKFESVAVERSVGLNLMVWAGIVAPLGLAFFLLLPLGWAAGASLLFYLVALWFVSRNWQKVELLVKRM